MTPITQKTTLNSFYKQCSLKNKYTYREVLDFLNALGDEMFTQMLDNKVIYTSIGYFSINKKRRHRTNMHQLVHFNKIWYLDDALKKFKSCPVWKKFPAINNNHVGFFKHVLKHNLQKEKRKQLLMFTLKNSPNHFYPPNDK